jgi:uncharacterized protein YbjT (DUF2867 family)
MSCCKLCCPIPCVPQARIVTEQCCCFNSNVYCCRICMSLLQAAERYLRASGLRYTIERGGAASVLRLTTLTPSYCMSLLQAAERYLRASGLRYTIVRPGGLRSEPPSEVGRLIVSKEDSLFGLDTDPGRAISRDTVGIHCCSSSCGLCCRV